ncbi:hypothetical protein ACFYKX_17380 [Cytobacillus sp. FJAT-54145]|uniref:Lipoprotein n=1 Tax=Cytobacillus spartinae TaxID=3299023 RepID=A0ABW6KDX3_9BACI
MKKVFQIFVIVFMVLTGCTISEETTDPKTNPDTEQPEKGNQNEDSSSDNNNQPDNQGNEDQQSNDIEDEGIDDQQSDHNEDQHTENIQQYFPKEKQKKFFKGIGNEFAEESEWFYEQEGNYLPSVLENGGTRILKVYKLTSEGLYLVYEEPEFYRDEIPSMETLQSAFKEKPLLLSSLKEGSFIGSWKVIKTNEELTVPLGEMDHVMVLEHSNGDGSISRQYWAPTFGLVKKEFYMEHEDGNETMVTSELERVEGH